MFHSISNHTESFLTASTVEHLIDVYKKLGYKYFVCTDDGLMTSSIKSYKLAEKSGLKFVGGVDFYFRDDNCNIISNNASSEIKYFKIILLAIDQVGYQHLVKMVSDFKSSIKIDGMQYPLLDWSKLEIASKYNIIATTSAIDDIVTKHLIVNMPNNAVKYYKKLKGLFGDNYYPAITTNVYESKKTEVVSIELAGGKKIVVPFNSRVVTDFKKKCHASWIANQPNKYKKLLKIEIGKILYDIKEENQDIVSVRKSTVFTDFKYDIQKQSNKLLIGLANKFGDMDRVVINSNSYYAEKEDHIVQKMKTDGKKPVLIKQHVQSQEEIAEYLEYLGVGSLADKISNNCDLLFERFVDFELKYEYRLVKYDNPEKKLIDLVKSVGRMRWDDVRYTSQFKEEFDLLTKNGVINLIPYFLPIVDILDFYMKNGELVGPARGSAAGFLISYLIGITHVNPIKYNLSSARFLTLDRIQQGNLPDIDCDLNSRKPLTGVDGDGGYLKEKYGNRYAQCSTRTLLRIKSAILDANRYINGVIEEDIVKLSKSLPNTPQGISDYDYIFGYDLDGNYVKGLIEKNEDLLNYTKDRPEEWEVVRRALSLSRQNGRHACSFALSDIPIEEIVPIMNVGGVDRVMQPQPKQIEAAGLIKYDFLTIVAAQLVGGTIKNINKNQGVDGSIDTGYFYHKGRKVFVWDLDDDPLVYGMLHRGDTVGVFQFSSKTMTDFIVKSKPTSIFDLSSTNALNRPGPLDFIDESTGRNMAEEWIERKLGRSKGKFKILDELLPETYGVITFQEQVSRLAKELAGMNVQDSENLRISIGKKKMKLMLSLKPVFIEGASSKIPKKEASEIWDMIVTFGRYSFNASHSVSYSIVAYACAFLKHHYPLDWWASVVSNTSNKKINEEYYKHIKDIVTPPDINKSNNDVTIDYEANKIRYPLSVISGLGEKTASAIISNRPYKDLVDFSERSGSGVALAKKLAVVGTIDSLFDKQGNEPIIDKIYQIDKAYAIKAKNKKILEYDIKASDANEKDAQRIMKNKDKYIKKDLKEISVDENYLRMNSLDILVMKKQLLPAFPVDLTNSVIKAHKDILNMGKPMMYDSKFKEQAIFEGSVFNEIEETLPFRTVVGWIIGYVIECKVFEFHSGAKQAFKIVLDCDGIVKERVIWPDYNTGVLKYNKDIKKGSILALLMYKGEGKERVSILEEKLLF